MEFYIALPSITYFEAYDFCKGLVFKNMKTIVAIRTLKEDKKNCQRSCHSKNPKKAHSSFWSREFPGVKDFVCGGQRYENAKSSYQNNESEEDEKPLTNFLGRSAIQGLNLARTTMMQQMMQLYRNTCDRSVNKKKEKSQKGTTRPPKMNKNTLHAFRHTPWWIFNL